MQRLPINDAGWLLIEGRQRPMHVGGLQLFELPQGEPGFLRQLADSAREDVDLRAPWNLRLARPYGLAGMYHWVEDEEVELEYHFRHLALPEPGRVRELLEIVSTLHANLLDRHRPLWESYLLEGLEGDRFALYTKAHHAMLDGVAAIRQLTTAFTHDPEARDLPPPWAERPGGDGDGEPDGFDPLALAGDFLRTVTTGITSTVGVVRTLSAQFAKAVSDTREAIPFQAPRSMLNVRLTSARRFVAQSYSLDRIRQVGKALDGTVNDVVLTMCSSALRTYLADQDALPSRPLIALVPVAFEREQVRGSGNAITLVPANLATHLDDPIERLELIRGSMTRVKERVGRMSPRELLSYGVVMTTPIMIGQLTGLSGRFPPAFNVVISNVPGPSEPLYWDGARMTGLYPLSLLTEGYAMNITQASYAGSMDFGITADRNALPSVQRMIDHLADALDELEHAAGL